MDKTVEGKAFVNGNFVNCCIAIKDGKITDIKKLLKSSDHIAFKNRIIIPSAIDLHVHFRDPGFTHKEDFKSGSIAAAFGGVSCVFDMPNTNPQTTTVQSISEKRINASKKSFVDFGIYAGIDNTNIENIKHLSKDCSCFKIYLGSTTNNLLFDKKNLETAIQNISKTTKTVFFHAEDNDCLNKNRIIENNLNDHLKARPSICEEISINNILNSSKNIESNLHICHLSSCEGLELLKGRPKNVSCGATPHHLLLSIEKVKNNSFYKVNPPIRSSFDKEALFNSLVNSDIDVVESDHAPHMLSEKEEEFVKAPSGIPGVETMYPLFLCLAKKGFISYERLFSCMCKKPAEIVKIPKGKIDVGYDADFIVIDLKKDSKIDVNKLHSKSGWSPFVGWPAIFPSDLFIRGERIIQDYEIQVSQGFGRFVGE